MPSEANAPTQEEITALHRKLDREAESGGYHLNPDLEFTKELVSGLIVNQRRYGYLACPCRLADGNERTDRDIICPCDYRDPDLSEWGSCFCALYVDDDIKAGKKRTRSIPERRPDRGTREKAAEKGTISEGGAAIGKLPLPVWRCTVCGYLCAREEPPLICPICKVKKDRFERFM